MKFGIFYELQLPRPWEPGGEHRLYQNALDQVELADRLGYDYAWEVEHHFLEEYSHSPAPEVFLGAASQRTKNIRLCHGIMQLTTTHPARCRRAHRRARPRLERPGRVRHRRERQHHRAGAVRRRLRREAGDLGGGDPGHHPDVHEGRGRASRQVFPHAAAQRRAEADAEAAPAAYGSPARRSRRSRWPGGAASARSPSSSCRPTRRMPGCTPITTPSPSASRSSPIT